MACCTRAPWISTPWRRPSAAPWAAGVRKTNLFDILNVPEIINYLAVARLCHEGDDVWANMSVHRDT